MSDNEEKNVGVSLPYEWAIKKTLGPTLDEIGVDLVGLYKSSKVGVAKIALAAKRKITGSTNDRTNLRVTRDVFWNGAFTDEDICAEYFGGILASSRSKDGKDDTGIFYLDLVKALSSSQLKLHYFIYASLNSMLANNDAYKDLNVALANDIEGKSIYFLTQELVAAGINFEVDLVALNDKNLVKTYSYNSTMHPDGHHITQITPTTLGVQLFAVAANQLNDFRDFNKTVFSNFDFTEAPPKSALTAHELIDSSK